MIDHATAERRSLSYHTAIAARIPIDPVIVERARQRVLGWLKDHQVAEPYARGWLEVLSAEPERLRSFLLEDSERARAFRQVSPFAGALDPRERWKLWALERQAHDPSAA